MIDLATVGRIDIGELRRVDERQVTWLWTEEYFDGPLNGACSVGGEAHWFVFHHDDEDGRYAYVLFPIHPEALSVMARRHADGLTAAPPADGADGPVAWFIDSSGEWRAGRDPRLRR